MIAASENYILPQAEESRMKYLETHALREASHELEEGQPTHCHYFTHHR